MAGDQPELLNKPEDSDFKQQRLKAWQPILTPGWVIFTFASVGVLFLGVGIAVLMSSNEVVEVISDAYQGKTAAGCVQGTNSTSTSCLVDVSMEVPKDMKAPIYMYYHLSNFYQNHRRYVKSRNDEQLRADNDFEVSNCEPLASRKCGTGTCAVYPCGLIGWSVFNDTFYQKKGFSPFTPGNAECKTNTDCVTVEQKDGVQKNVLWSSSSIAWASDKDKKFIASKKPVPYGDAACAGVPTSTTCITMPYDNFKYYKCSDTTITDMALCPQGKRYADVSNEEFIVWMRTSGLPNFRKLHRIIKTDLKKGEKLHFFVNNVFPVTAFKGTKKIVLSTTTWIGGKNAFLGWMYIIVAILCILLAIAFAIKEAWTPRKPTSELENALNDNK